MRLSPSVILLHVGLILVGAAEAEVVDPDKLLHLRGRDVETGSAESNQEVIDDIFLRSVTNLRSAASAVSESFQVIDDVFVRDSSPTKNYNSVTNLGVAFGPGSNERITYVKFPISFDVRNADSISSATLRMRVNQAPTTSLTLQFFMCDTESWSESVITWNNRPTYDNSTAPLATRTLVPSDDDTWLDFDMLAPVIAAAQANQASLSLVIEPVRPGDSSSQAMKFDSKEDLNNIPVLEITYVPSQATGSPTASPSAVPTIDPEQPDYAQLVSVAMDGSLQYEPYANEINVVQGSTANPAAVNTVPDYSGVGYKGGGVPIPFVSVAQTVSPTSGDRRLDLQAAINAVAALPLDSNGLRGAVLLQAGDYEVSYPGLDLHDSGIVIRGQGQGDTGGTKIIYTSTVQDSYAVTLGFTNGGLDNSDGGATQAVTDSYVPVGSKTVNIANAAGYAVGDRIIIRLQPNNDWLLHMSNMAQWGWTTSSYSVQWRREVTEVNGNQLTLNAPIVQAIEAVYGGAIVYRYAGVIYNDEDREIENVGVENIRIESIFASDDDENHGKHAVRVQRVNNAWVRQVTARYFWGGAVYLRRYSLAVTVEDTASLDPKGTLAGGRRYGFVIDDGDLHLVQRCYVSDGRHDFASGSRTSGPHVYVDSLSVDSYNDIGPHERFSTGQLYDNIKTNSNPLDDNDNGGEMNAQNRGSSGSGHGWAGVQIMFWNSEANRWRVLAANGAMNWAIGMIGEKGTPNRVPEPYGIIQSQGTHVTPRSLYYAQLQERIGANALRSVVLPIQETGSIWNELGTWQGNGLFGDPVVAWLDKGAVPVPTGTSLDIGGMVRDLNLLGNSPTYSWSVTSGPGSVTFGDASQLETTASFDAPGAYSLEISVSDGASTETGTLDVTVEGPAVTFAPSANPVPEPSDGPSLAPSSYPTYEPSGMPSSLPSVNTSREPSGEPSSVPSANPVPESSAEPSSVPSFSPTHESSGMPSSLPSTHPTPRESDTPSSLPSANPTSEPSGKPSSVPSANPTRESSGVPSSLPSANPTPRESDTPSSLPTSVPSANPIREPSGVPSSVPSADPETPSGVMEWGTISNVGSIKTTVNLSNTYTNAVVVTSIQYVNNAIPVVTRISSVTSTSFDVQLQSAGAGTVVADSVNYVVVEEGQHTIELQGGIQHKIEAQKYASTVTDENNSWSGEAQTYLASYTNPVVVGQVMSSNDAKWSVFWDKGANRNAPPSSSTLFTGMTVCEDSDIDRVSETVGFIVFEAGHGIMNGFEFEAKTGADSIRGIGNSPPYTYTFTSSFATTPVVAVASMAGVDGNNGGWAYVYGSEATTADALNVAIDEDTIRDTERRHTSEQVAYIVFSGPGSA